MARPIIRLWTSAGDGSGSPPDGDCGLKVGGETRRWEEGRCIVFDDSLEHEAWNHTSEPRIVLIIDFWHPDLTPTEIAYLEGLHRFASFQAVSLNRYWVGECRGAVEGTEALRLIVS